MTNPRRFGLARPVGASGARTVRTTAVSILVISALGINDRLLPEVTSSVHDMIRWLGAIFLCCAAAEYILGSSARWLVAVLPLIYILGNSGLRIGIATFVFFCAIASLGPSVKHRRQSNENLTLRGDIGIQIVQALPLVLAFLIAWSATLRLTSVVLWVFCMAAIVWGVRSTRLRFVGSQCREDLNSLVRPLTFVSFSIGLALITWPFRWSTMPSVMYDDLSTHLRWFSRLRDTGQLTYDSQAPPAHFGQQVNDVLHGAISLLSSSDARSGLALVMGILALLFANSIWASAEISQTIRWMCLVVIASTPWFAYAMTNLQTELLSSAVVLCLVRQITAAEIPNWRHFAAFFATLCFLISIKLTALPAAVALGTVGLISFRPLFRKGIIDRSVFRSFHSWSLVSALVLVFQPFVLSKVIHGEWLYVINTFPSELPFTSDASLRLPVEFGRMFFYTGEFWEAKHLTAGFHFLLILPVGLLLIAKPVVKGRAVLAVGLYAALAGSFVVTQNYRYLLPVLVSLFVVGCLTFKDYWSTRWLAAPLLTCAALNFLVGASPSWVMQRSNPSMFARASGRTDFVAQVAPERLLTDRLVLEGVESRVLYSPSSPAGGTLRGTPLYLSWIDPRTSSKWKAIEDGASVAQVVRDLDVEAIIYRSEDYDDKRGGSVLREFLVEYGIGLDKEGNYTAYGVKDYPLEYSPLFAFVRGKGFADSASEIVENGRRALGESSLGERSSVEVSKVDIRTVRQLRYQVSGDCDGDYFIAQLNFYDPAIDGSFESYYRPVPCDEGRIEFVDVVLVPDGFPKALLFVSTWNASVVIEQLTLEGA